MSFSLGSTTNSGSKERDRSDGNRRGGMSTGDLGSLAEWTVDTGCCGVERFSRAVSV